MPRATSQRTTLLFRLFLLAALLGGLAALGLHFDADQLEIADIRSVVARAGTLGALAYLAIFALGNLVQVPSLVFIGAGILIFGPITGSALALTGAVLALALSFWVARTVGGQPLADLERPFLKKWLGRAERYPIRTLVVLRSVFLMSPLITYPLAFSPMRYRDYLLGSALGLVAPVAVIATLLDWFVS